MNDELNFTEAQQQRIDDCLNTLLAKTKAHTVILADATGQLVGKAGIMDNRGATVLSALAAGSFAAASEMSRFLGRSTGFSQSFHEGREHRIYCSTVSPSLLLTIAFDAKARLGLVRIFAGHAVEELEEIIAEAQASRVQPEEIDKVMDSDFSQLLAKELDSLFADE